MKSFLKCIAYRRGVSVSKDGVFLKNDQCQRDESK